MLAPKQGSEVVEPPPSHRWPPYGTRLTVCGWAGHHVDRQPRCEHALHLVRYGRDLIANTAHYLGPQGIVDHRTNGMNCQNCHLRGRHAAVGQQLRRGLEPVSEVPRAQRRHGNAS